MQIKEYSASLKRHVAKLGDPYVVVRERGKISDSPHDWAVLPSFVTRGLGSILLV